MSCVSEKIEDAFETCKEELEYIQSQLEYIQSQIDAFPEYIIYVSYNQKALNKIAGLVGNLAQQRDSYNQQQRLLRDDGGGDG